MKTGAAKKLISAYMDAKDAGESATRVFGSDRVFERICGNIIDVIGEEFDLVSDDENAEVVRILDDNELSVDAKFFAIETLSLAKFPAPHCIEREEFERQYQENGGYMFCPMAKKEIADKDKTISRLKQVLEVLENRLFRPLDTDDVK